MKTKILKQAVGAILLAMVTAVTVAPRAAVGQPTGVETKAPAVDKEQSAIIEQAIRKELKKPISAPNTINPANK